MKQSDGQQVQVAHRLHDPAALVKLATHQVLVFLWLDQTSESGRRLVVVTLGNWGLVSFCLLDYIITGKNFITVKLIIEAPAYTVFWPQPPAYANTNTFVAILLGHIMFTGRHWNTL